MNTWYDSSINSNILRKTYVNGFLDVSQNLNVRSNMYVNGDVSFNSTGRVDVCGNFYAQYPENSIPISAIIGDNENKANLDYVDASLNLKADKNTTNDAIALKANLDYVDNSLNLKADMEATNDAIALKSDLTYVDASLNLKADMEATNADIAIKANLDYVDASLNLKADMKATNDAIALKANLDYVDASLNLKADISNATFTGKSTFTEIVVNDNLTVTKKTTLGDDVSMNANVDISGNLAINGNLSVFKNQSTEIINTTVNEYTSIVTEDISLNGGLSVSGDSSFNSHVTIQDLSATGNTTIQGELEVDGDVSFNNGLSVGGNLNVTGTVSGPTAASGTNTTQLATTAFVTDAVAAGGVDTDSDLSLNAGLSVGGDVSLNAGLSVGGNITIPDKSINITALKNNNNLADTTYKTFVITASGNKYYINGVLQDTIILYRGLKYSLDVNDGSTGSHPFYIQTTDNGGAYDAANVYNDGITNNGATTGIIDFIVPDNAPDTLYYRCSAHGDMGGIIQLENYLNISDNLILSKNLNVTGTVSGPTATSGTNTTQLATTAFVTTAIADGGGGGGVDPDSDLSLNAGLSVGGDVSFNKALNVNSLTVSNGLTVGTSQITQSAFTSLLTQLGDDIDGENSGDWSGSSVSLSADGSIVAIGAYKNNSFTGHVRVYQRDSTKTIADTDPNSATFGPVGWNRLGHDIDGEAGGDYSGESVSLSADGLTVAIGARQNNSGTGHVRVYQREYTKTTADTVESSATFGPVGWNRLGHDIDGEAGGDYSGQSVSLSADGLTVAIGAYGNNSQTGHVRVYQYDSTKTTADTFGPVGWNQLGHDIDGEASSDRSGYSVSLSADGSIVAIGAQGNNSYTGHVRVYQYDSTKTNPVTDQSLNTFGPVGWNRLGHDIDGENSGDWSGISVSLSADGLTVAIGAAYNNSYIGYVRVYQYDSTKNTADDVQSSATFGPVGWNRLGHDIDGEASNDSSGYSVSLSADGSIVAIGAYGNNSLSGHVRVYQYDSTKTTADDVQSLNTFGPVGWNRLGHDIDGEATNDRSGWSVSLSADGLTVAIGAWGNNSSTGHVRVYKLPRPVTSLALDNLFVTGTLSKGSGTFKIDHPLPEKQDTHNLVHSFIEGPRMDNIYRGHVHLVNGLAEINLDTQFNMTEGTFVALNRDLSVFTTNEDDWDNVRGKVTGNILTIECQNTESTALISYLVIGERQDKHAKETYITDMDGRLITEPLKIRA